jgi:predicted ArsR family transcriptional regulator
MGRSGGKTFVTGEPGWRSALRSLIRLRLEQHGPQTTHEIANGCRVSLAAVAPRMTEMEAEGTAYDTGSRRSPTGRGRKQKVWAATSE